MGRNTHRQKPSQIKARRSRGATHSATLKASVKKPTKKQSTISSSKARAHSPDRRPTLQTAKVSPENLARMMQARRLNATLPGPVTPEMRRGYERGYQQAMKEAATKSDQRIPTPQTARPSPKAQARMMQARALDPTMPGPVTPETRQRYEQGYKQAYKEMAAEGE